MYYAYFLINKQKILRNCFQNKNGKKFKSHIKENLTANSILCKLKKKN